MYHLGRETAKEKKGHRSGEHESTATDIHHGQDETEREQRRTAGIRRLGGTTSGGIRGGEKEKKMKKRSGGGGGGGGGGRRGEKEGRRKRGRSLTLPETQHHEPRCCDSRSSEYSYV